MRRAIEHEPQGTPRRGERSIPSADDRRYRTGISFSVWFPRLDCSRTTESLCA